MTKKEAFSEALKSLKNEFKGIKDCEFKSVSSSTLEDLDDAGHNEVVTTIEITLIRNKEQKENKNGQ